MKIVQFLKTSPWGDVTPATLLQGMGVRETAVVQLAEQWSDMGHEVVSFVSVEKTVRNEKKSGGVSIYTEADNVLGGINALQPDLLLTWEDPSIARASSVRDSAKVILMGMQVAHIPPGDIMQMCLEDLDKVVCLSDYAANVLVGDNKGFIGRDDIAIIPNCVDIDLFPAKAPRKNSVPTAIYSSSPDRGLQTLVHVWPMVKEALPDAQLHVCYGVENWFQHSLFSHSRDGMHALDIRDFLGLDSALQPNGQQSPGVNYHGKVGQDQLHELMRESHCLAFPCETQSPTETGCITVIEALASYTHPVLGSCDCLPSEYSEVASFVDLPVDHRAYADALISGLKGELPNQAAKVKNGRSLAEQRTWGNAAKMYIDLVEGIIDAKNS